MRYTLFFKSIFNFCILDIKHAHKTATSKMQQEGKVNIPHSSWGHQGEYDRIKKLQHCSDSCTVPCT